MQREKVISFSSQPEAYQCSIPMSHAKERREKVGCDRRVCAAVLVDRFGTREQIDVDDHFANVASGVDRGTYQGSQVSRKGA
jgi:hypothetical protein